MFEALRGRSFVVMTSRGAETRLATFTLIYLIGYAPLETWASWPRLTSPSYLIDAIAMVLLLWGGVHSLAKRPRRAPGLLTAGWAWTAANYWRAFFDRVQFVREGGAVQLGNAEYWTVGGALVMAMVCLALSASMTATLADHG